MGDIDFCVDLPKWIDPPHKTIKRLSLFSGYSDGYIFKLKGGRRKATEKAKQNILQAMRLIDLQTPPKLQKKDYAHCKPTPRNLAGAAGLMKYTGRPCLNCGGTDRYVSGAQCVVCGTAPRSKKQRIRAAKIASATQEQAA